jgi:CRISPR-associated protein (TIGR02710 family)
MTTLIVASVGGSPQPIIFSINNQRPDYVIYFVSPDSRPKVWDEIEPALEHRPKDREIIVTSDEQNLNAGVKVLMERLPGIYEQWHIAPEEVIGEFTGGTKAMSSALVLALSDSGARFSYIGGEVRDKAGLGVVMNGKERMFHLDNPWDTMALHDLKVFREKYESFQWQAAAEIARQAASRTEVQRPLFLTLEQMCKGYSLWDNFEHREACNLLQQVGGNLKTIAAGANQKESLYALSQDVRNNAYFLSQVIAEMDVLNERTRKKKKSIEPEDILTHHYLIRDLLSNAKRRAEQRHFDDAVARLYGTVEKIAKI